MSRIGETIRHYGRRAAYAVGIGPTLNQDFRVRFHWLVMWTGFLVFAASAYRRRALDFWQALLLVFIAVYLGPLIIVGGIQSYGYRMVVPVVPSVMLLAVTGCEPLVRQLVD